MKLQVFNIVISLISSSRLAGEGRIKEILGLDDLAELPLDVRPLLKQDVLPKGTLAPLQRIKSAATRELTKRAVRSPFGGWHIGTDKAGELLSNLAELKTEFDLAKADLIAHLEDTLQEHLNAIRAACEEKGYPHTDAFIAAIREVQPDTAYVERQVNFEYLKPRWVEYDPEDAEVVREGVYGQALHEIAVRATEAARAQAVKARLRTVDEIASKLDGLAYIEPRLGRIGNELRDTFAETSRVETEREYDAMTQMAVAHALQVLGDEDNLARAVEQSKTLFQCGDPTAVTIDREESSTDDDREVVVPLKQPEAAIRVPQPLLQETGTFAW